MASKKPDPKKRPAAPKAKAATKAAAPKPKAATKAATPTPKARAAAKAAKAVPTVAAPAAPADLRPGPLPVLGDIPWSYGQTRITAIARDPHCVFVYWEYPDQALEEA